MTAPDDIAALAAGLTEAQRRMMLDSAPGGWGRADTATGADVYGSGRWAVAKALIRKGLGDIYEDGSMWPPALYFNNRRGLAVRQHLLDKERG